MPVQSAIAERIDQLRARAQRYKGLAEILYDRRMAAEVAVFAKEIEAEVARLERSHRLFWRGGDASQALAS